LIGTPFAINMYADLASYIPYEQGGDVGTIYYKIKIREHRKVTVSTYKKKENKAPKKTSTGQRPSNNSSVSYKATAKSGLHLRTGPNSTIIGLIPYGTTVSSDGKKNGNWYHVKYGSKWGYAYNTWLKKV